MLESSTIPSFLKQGLICIFTVVPNIYFGLQCTEHTCYDIILISHDLKYSNAIHFARSLRNIGVQTPIILVQNDLSLHVMHEHGAMFCSLLQKPFSANTLNLFVKKPSSTIIWQRSPTMPWTHQTPTWTTALPVHATLIHSIYPSVQLWMTLRIRKQLPTRLCLNSSSREFDAH